MTDASELLSPQPIVPPTFSSSRSGTSVKERRHSNKWRFTPENIFTHAAPKVVYIDQYPIESNSRVEVLFREKEQQGISSSFCSRHVTACASKQGDQGNGPLP
jgi:hypothetical protein